MHQAARVTCGMRRKNQRMSLQYLTNVNPPPAESVLQYDVEPGIVYVSTPTESMYADLTITVYNPTSAPVNCMKFQIGFVADADSDALVNVADITKVVPVSDQNTWSLNSSGWDGGNPNLYLYNFEPSGISEYLPLAAGESFVFHLNQVKIVTSEGIAPLTIVETTGRSMSDRKVVRGSIGLNKTVGALSITSFNVSPAEPIIPGTPVVLSWEITGADQWRVYDVEAAVLLYDSTSTTEPNLMSWPVAPQQLAPPRDTFYLLVARSGQLFNMRVAAAMVMAAHFIANPTAEPSTINPGGTSMLHWTTKWASRITISAPGLHTEQFNAPPGQYDVFPDAPGNQFEVKPNYTVPYTLTVAGPGNSSDTKQVMVAVNLPTPSVTSFEISPNPPVAFNGQNLYLSWQSLYGYNATLGQRIRGTGKIINLQDVPLNASGFAVTPAGISDFILTIYGDEAATAEITGIEWVGVTKVGHNPSALLFDGSYIWVACHDDKTVSKIDPTSMAVVGTYSVPYSPTGLAFDGTYIWVANDFTVGGGFTTTVTKLKASDGSNAGNVTVGNAPMSVAFDGNNIWVANAADSTVMKLNPQNGSVLATFGVGQTPVAVLFDGWHIWTANSDSNSVSKLPLEGNTVLGTYKVGNNPNSLTSDGTNIWVANQNDGTVTKLRASDGSVLGNFTLDAKIDPTLTAAAFDGKNVWIGGFDSSGKYWLFVLNPDGSLLFDPIHLSIYDSDLYHPTALVFDENNMWVALYDTPAQDLIDYVMKL
jgi:sugar lactone lactonase YvrE